VSTYQKTLITQRLGYLILWYLWLCWLRWVFCSASYKPVCIHPSWEATELHK
jgi:hypothetical protein